MAEKKDNEEIFRVNGAEIVKKVEDIIKEGNARRIIIKKETGETIMEFPVTVGLVGLVISPILAALGALAALATNAVVVVERREK